MLQLGKLFEICAFAFCLLNLCEFVESENVRAQTKLLCVFLLQLQYSTSVVRKSIGVCISAAVVHNTQIALNFAN